ncbi:GNAT family N-acetyltransferase [Pseudomonas syringae]|nr:GNAT family N-acetyltransferase [Pseudomonas syringae]
MTIRIAIPKDSLQVATIHLESWKSAYQGIIPSAYIDRITLEARLSHWTQEITSGDSDVYVKVDAFDRVLGWVATGSDREHPEDRSVAEVHAVYVSPLHTRQACPSISTPRRPDHNLTHIHPIRLLDRIHKRTCNRIRLQCHFSEGFHRLTRRFIGNPVGQF